MKKIRILSTKIMQLLSRIIRRVATTSKLNTDDFLPKIQITSQGGASYSEVISPYGYSYSPPIGSFGIQWNIMGNMDDRVTICYSPKTSYAKDLKEGEVKIGNEIKKTYIHFDKDGNIEIVSSSDINLKSTDGGIVNLGENGNKIARLGDEVQVEITDGSSAGIWNGTITSSGENKSA